MKANSLMIIGLLFTTSCSSMFHIIDDYCVSNEYDNNQLFCNPEYKNSPFVEYVKSIKWDYKTIIVEQQLPNDQHNWFLVVDKNDSLHCYCLDSLFGPFSVQEKDSVLMAREIDISKLKEKEWRSPY